MAGPGENARASATSSVESESTIKRLGRTGITGADHYQISVVIRIITKEQRGQSVIVHVDPTDIGSGMN
ncbi:hypothetical protein GUJ93_ZPchr0013g35645 [Zizania palustris]|uniref:Uncharacterized protein n=1 Tax=Zizania palustris TaxID=103762 RepID=A0A8J6C699_ZIZPA|nr:hypothetical protein GUJ93_ZPchr0013g35645 [Zizania palustris]